MNTSLVKKAKEFKSRRRQKKSTYSEEDCALGLAYIMGEINGPQVVYAKGKKISSVHAFAINAIAKGLREGWIKVV